MEYFFSFVVFVFFGLFKFSLFTFEGFLKEMNDDLFAACLSDKVLVPTISKVKYFSGV